MERPRFRYCLTVVERASDEDSVGSHKGVSRSALARLGGAEVGRGDDGVDVLLDVVADLSEKASIRLGEAAADNGIPRFVFLRSDLLLDPALATARAKLIEGAEAFTFEDYPDLSSVILKQVGSWADAREQGSEDLDRPESDARSTFLGQVQGVQYRATSWADVDQVEPLIDTIVFPTSRGDFGRFARNFLATRPESDSESMSAAVGRLPSAFGAEFPALLDQRITGPRELAGSKNPPRNLRVILNTAGYDRTASIESATTAAVAALEMADSRARSKVVALPISRGGGPFSFTELVRSILEALLKRGPFESVKHVHLPLRDKDELALVQQTFKEFFREADRAGGDSGGAATESSGSPGATTASAEAQVEDAAAGVGAIPSEEAFGEPEVKHAGIDLGTKGGFEPEPDPAGDPTSEVAPETDPDSDPNSDSGDPLYRPQPPSNDVPSGADLLDVESEVFALAESIALKDAEPPLVVGILGGWGWGKSFVLHLFTQRLMEIRCHPLRVSDGGDVPGYAKREFPYVGHPYVVRFDAWTFAKSSLWASLMRQIFVELDRQLGIEDALSDAGRSLLADTDLWRQLSEASEVERRALLESELGRETLREAREGETLWTSLQRLREREAKELERAEEELAAREAELAVRQADAADAVRAELAREARWDAFLPAFEALSGQLGAEAGRVVAGARAAGGDPPTIDALERTARPWRRVLLGSTPLVVGLAAVALASLLLPLLFATEAWQRASGVATAVLTAALAFWEWSRKRLAGAQAFVEGYLARLDRLQDERVERQEAAVEAARERVAEEARPALQEARALVEERRQRVGITANRASLLDLIRDRLEHRVYERRLGLMHQVKSDLEELTEALLPESRRADVHDKLFPRGDPRVVLIIDDLDRCPPKRVVEVLEAAQLLVKTRLFVVVLAMDVRYVTRALEKVYEGVLVRDGKPSGLDYIEKIVQVPYRVRPIEAESIEGFLREHMIVRSDGPEPAPDSAQPGAGADADDMPDVGMFVSDPGAGVGEPELEATGFHAPPPPDAAGAEPPPSPSPAPSEDPAEPEVPERVLEPVTPIPTEVLEFEESELVALRDACEVAQISPRSAKRLVNVFKLMKIVWYRRSDSPPTRGVKCAMALLLTLSARHPLVLRELLPALEECFQHGGSAARTLRAFLLDRCTAGADRVGSDFQVQEEWRRTHSILERSPLLSDALTLGDLTPENARLVSSFSFVSDPLWERHVVALDVPAQEIVDALAGGDPGDDRP